MTYPVLNRSDVFFSSFTPMGRGERPGAGLGIEHAIAQASAKTGVSFSYLINNAKAESGLDPAARAKTSSASGLYQFTQKTWLQMVRDHGADVGLSEFAACVDDQCHVVNAETRRDILALRQDPQISAVMAAKYAEMNAAQLEKTVGDRTDIGDTELYLAHVFGASGATKFIRNMDHDAKAVAAQAFPVEARANPGIFYKDGKAQSFRQIYDRFSEKFEDTAISTTTTQGARDARMNGQEDDMIGQVNKGYRTWVRRPSTGGAINAELLGVTPDKVSFEGMMSDRTAYDFKGVRGAALEDRTVSDAVVDDLLTAHQPALLVMAQSYRHNQNSRYNG